MKECIVLYVWFTIIGKRELKRKKRWTIGGTGENTETDTVLNLVEYWEIHGSLKDLIEKIGFELMPNKKQSQNKHLVHVSK